MGVLQFNFFVNKITQDEEKKRAIFKLDIADCVNVAYVGSQGGRSGYNYKCWREKLMRVLDPDFYKRKAKEFWNKLRKRSFNFRQKKR